MHEANNKLQSAQSSYGTITNPRNMLPHIEYSQTTALLRSITCNSTIITDVTDLRQSADQITLFAFCAIFQTYHNIRIKKRYYLSRRLLKLHQTKIWFANMCDPDEKSQQMQLSYWNRTTAASLHQSISAFVNDVQRQLFHGTKPRGRDSI